MQTPWAVVVGEVADVKEGSPDASPRMQYYGAVEQVENLSGRWAILPPTSTAMAATSSSAPACPLS